MAKLILLFFIPLLLFANMPLSKQEQNYIKNKKIIYVSNEYDYEPYDFNRENTPLGYSIDLLNILLENTGLKVKYVTKPWDELLKDLNDKKIDLVHTIYKTPQREKLYKFSNGYSKVVNSYIIRKDTKDITDIEELFGKKVGISKGWSEEIFFNKYPQITKIYYDNLEKKLEALTLGKIDAIINSTNVANYHIKKYGYSDLKISNPVKEIFAEKLDDHHFVTLKDNLYLISILNKAYSNLSIETISELNKKWFGKVEEKIYLTSEERKYLNDKKFISMCVDPHWMPFESLNSNGKYEGISADFFTLFNKNLSINFKLIKTNSWNESMDFAKQRKCDILSLAAITPNREKYFNFTNEYLESSLVIATKLDVSFIDNIHDLENKKIGIIKDYATIELLKNKYPFLDIVEVKNIEDGMNRVLKGELFGYVDTLPVISYYFQKFQKYELKIAGKIDFNWRFRIAVRNDDPVLLNILQKAIDSVSFEEKRKILNKWIAIKYEKGVDYSLLWKLIAIFFVISILIIFKQYMMNKSIKEFTKLIDSTMEAIIIFKNNKCIDANNSAVKMFEYNSKKDFLGKTIFDIISEESEQNSIEKLINTPYEIIVKKNKDLNFYALINIYQIKEENIIVLSVVDITHLKQLEAQTKQAQMGEMIENIAHQWRQPLSTISTISSGIKLKYEMDVPIETNSVIDDMSKIINTTNYLSDTIDIFRNFLKEEKEYKEVILQDRINIALEIVSGSLRNNQVELRNKIDTEPIKIFLVVGELGQVLINILNNAKDALKEKEIPNPWIELNLIKEEDRVIITLEDNGGGIKEENISKIFNPYFTTKHAAQGTGLGLYMSYKIIKNSLKGNLSVENTKNGAKFIIELPLF